VIDEIEVQCPYCGERVWITVEPDTWGSLVQDCEVCCNPWQMTVTRDRYGDPDVKVEKLE
jgi:Cysteine-rich CPXCG